MSAHRLEELAAGSVAGGLDKKELSEFQRLLRDASSTDKAQVASILNTGALAALSIRREKAPFGLLQKIIPRVVKQSKELDRKVIPGGLKFVWGSDDSEWLPMA